ncbi:DUF305 domain-containing protein [Agromyces sp. ISL-38]|uniref:DUF305 domain-containing protein n=1 Tax=Agromyces sp. ISL-38 TaxID=2819107 RepID=UPI001BE5F9D5|nr:DUF305 domain-containing protein [Agromyces sp. ISL-38]MBT2497799.1 DUF305 domain-containing protein [Agromyces sp. ISL-38]
MLNTRNLLLVSAAAAATLALSGCAGGMSGMDMSGSDAPADSKTSAGTFNGADVTFAQMMIPHHEQAVEMSETLLAEDGIDDRVRDLATRIKDAQQPEIDQLKGMLSDWGQEESDMGGMNHGDGMMSDDDMTALEDATGDDAARLFLEQMTVHHEGAIEMAQAEAADGENAEATKLAETIIAAQTDEIAVMKEMLADF